MWNNIRLALAQLKKCSISIILPAMHSLRLSTTSNAHVKAEITTDLENSPITFQSDTFVFGPNLLLTKWIVDFDLDLRYFNSEERNSLPWSIRMEQFTE
jgi:hypothetical protein